MKQLYLILLLITTLGYGQNPAFPPALRSLSFAQLDSLMAIEIEKGDYQRAIPYTMAGREKAQATVGVYDSLYSTYTANLAFFYQELGEYEKAEPIWLELLRIDVKVLGPEHPDFALDLNNLGALYNYVGKYEAAAALFLQAKEIQTKVLGADHPDLALSLNNLAAVYRTTGQYEQAEPLYLQAKNIWMKAFGAESSEYALSLNNLAFLYQALGDYDKATEFFIQAKDLRAKILGPEHPLFATTLTNLASLYQDLKAYQKAEVLYLQANAIKLKILGNEHPSIANGLHNLATLYGEMEEYAKAEKLFLQAKEMREKIFGWEHPNVARSLVSMAEFYRRRGELDKALRCCLQSIDANSDAVDSSIYECDKTGAYSAAAVANWGTLDRHSYYANEEINRALDLLMSILKLQYEKNKDKRLLETHYKIAEAAIRLNAQIRNSFTDEGAKLRSLADNHRFVLSAIESADRMQQKNWEQAAFGFAEMDKGVLLMDAARSERAYFFGNLPDSVMQQEKALQQKMMELKAALLEKRGQESQDSLNRELVAINQKIVAFSQNMKAKYPKYIDIKYAHKTATLGEVQALLDDKTAVLEYVIGEEWVYIFYIDKKQLQVSKIALQADSLKQQIKKLQAALSGYELLQTDAAKSYQQYTSSAYWFYKELVAKPLTLAKGIKKLVIIPDGELAHLPFESFLVEAAGPNQPYSDLHYLVKDYSISYNYSATVWNENSSHQRSKNNGQFFAVAANYTLKSDSASLTVRSPVYRNLRYSLQPLPAARNEVLALSEKYNGFFAFDSLAVEQTFKNKAGEYAIIHLAMHGLLNEKSPILSSLVFTENGDSVENNFLQAYEISKMQLNADLVVLSACETGYGKFEKGNGTASLARAFMYAGVPALVVSLWQVNDASTAMIMQMFYKNLAKGLDKAVALQQAKLEYIKIAGADNANAAHPAFWAPFIQLGDSRPIAVAAKRPFMAYWPWLAGGLLAAAGAGIYALRRRQKAV